MRTIYLSIMFSCIICNLHAQSIKINVSSPGTYTYSCPNDENYETYTVTGTGLDISGANFKWVVENGIITWSGSTSHEGYERFIKIKWSNTHTTGKVTVSTTIAGRSYSNTFNSKIMSLIGLKPIFRYPGTNTITRLPGDTGTEHIEVLPQRYHHTNQSINAYEWEVPEGWGKRIINERSIEITPDAFTGGIIKVRPRPLCGRDIADSYSSIRVIGRDYSFIKAPSSINYGSTQALTYEFTRVANVLYEWVAPEGWNLGNTGTNILTTSANSVVIIPKTCTNNTNVQVRMKYGNKYSKWFQTSATMNSLRIATNNASPELGTTNVYYLSDIVLPVGSQIVWSGTGVNILSGQGTTILGIVISSIENPTIQAKITLPNCSQSTTLTYAIKSVKSSYNIAFSGKTDVCLETPYTITSAIVSDISFIWSVTGSIAITSSNTANPCKIKAIGEGTGQITVKAKRNNIIISEWTLTVNTSTKLPLAPTYMGGFDANGGYFHPNALYSFFTSAQYAQYYIWDVRGGEIVSTGYDGGNITIATNSAQMDIYLSVNVYSANSCGVSLYHLGRSGYIPGSIEDLPPAPLIRSLPTATKENTNAIKQDLTTSNSFATIIYPNPTNGHFTLELPEYTSEQEINLQILTETGDVVINEKYKEATKSFNISPSPNGLYIVRITIGGVVVSKKIIKQ